ncbi:Uncharacterised protein [Vibrio cholerae]|uniref:hypothetical protein n=1 Tax=Vibrio cholerae TaxID=666 RepID=UPI000C70234F|nr:hypothetical protein [Vibrio cholerae]EGQ8224802.1 hypothetical protein [Vibrio cholerae]KAA1212358.1 hypothetical protein F0M02_07955 [Vibrio cholerae]TXZ02205.1 hypothetical protein FXE62_18315 [Vibrio cholerae]SNC56243.1 Uncharacterised protein [Vibrio cholerae]GHY18727.1 hypothetical protein VCSRO69_2287 [Vibrio cholerae]
MTASTELVVPNLTAAEFKAKIIDFIKSRDFKSELLRQILSALPDDKLALFEEYRTDSTTDPISEDSYKWEREGGAYFALQLHMAEENFCLQRLEHLIQVKSHLTERGIAGFSRPVSSSITSHEEAKSTKEYTMNVDFSSVDLTGFTPSRSLSNSVNNDDISSIRNALFMEMNDDHLSTIALRQAIAWTYSKHPNLFVAYEENAYSQGMEHEQTKWNDHYYGMQEVYASSNFSLERIRHLVAVREHVFTIAQDDARPATVPNTQPQQAPKPSFPLREQSSTGSTHRPESKPENNVLKSLLLIGGVVAAIALVILAVIV